MIATIKLKETTASDIFRRLNSYSKQYVLYRTVKAFGQIIKSLFILRYLDELELRQAIEKQLNKVKRFVSQAGLVPVIKFLRKVGMISLIVKTVDHERGANALYDAVDAVFLTVIAT
ncbi:MAG: Tn3 family transposase [Desulforhopalus sp.]|nr:Tn3 family transposase [Desulforhopalus sp.]